MAFPPQPEVADKVGCLDDDAFGLNDFADAFGLRELIRGANAYVARGELMFRWMNRAGDIAWNTDDNGESQGAGLGFAWPFWYPLVPQPPEGLPAMKKPGITKMRAAFRLNLEDGKRMDLAIGTIARPFEQNWAASNYITATGAASAASTRYAKDDILVHPGPDELLQIMGRGVVDPATDAQMVAATYGGKATGTLTGGSTTSGLAIDNSIGTGGSSLFNMTGNSQVHVGGHYVVFTSQLDGRQLWGPCAIIDVYRGTDTTDPGRGKGFIYTPAHPGVINALGSGITYTIYKLPRYRLRSIACYGAARTA